MQLILNDKMEIMAYVKVGKTENGIDYDGSMPADFFADFEPQKYKLMAGVVAINADYVKPEINLPAPTLTQQDNINAHFFKMALDFKKQLKEMESNG